MAIPHSFLGVTSPLAAVTKTCACQQRGGIGEPGEALSTSPAKSLQPGAHSEIQTRGFGTLGWLVGLPWTASETCLPMVGTAGSELSSPTSSTVGGFEAEAGATQWHVGFIEP